MYQIIQWSSDQQVYQLSEEFSLIKADKDEWGIYSSVYYNSEYNGFFKENVYDFHLQRDPFWIYKGEQRIGGVVIAPNVLYLLFFIPPFHEEFQVVTLLKKALLRWSDPSKPIIVYEILQDHVDFFSRAGFWPDEFRCKWMQRPTELYALNWDEDMIAIEPQLAAENDDTRKLINSPDIERFFYECNMGSIDAIRRKQESADCYKDMIGSYAYQTNELTLAASTLVYDRQSNRLIGACLVSWEGYFPAIYNIGVLQEYRGRGLATNMLKKALTMLKPHFPILRLYVMQGNSAESVYYNLGFKPGPLEVQRFHLPNK
ncbi:GNAT family N-acetyltransferase [Paenibacillus sp. N3/727]|uniref:GNAT family N-acetyltransferase n=1 Tax=Paenibacillus sp. N3/727 TaxID=2925845 RepID=UPI001F530193|nr:GNAT family N-acetyltransferase [Paenibacillus sp. N3/727]UNK16928.1 GNAT family N-acetyltransferase [Paenibacillus sp. N3/727]